MTEHTPSGFESPVDLARWDHAKWLQKRLGECRAENTALVERLEQTERDARIAQGQLLAAAARYPDLVPLFDEVRAAIPREEPPK